jgi:hypothetical protein
MEERPGSTGQTFARPPDSLLEHNPAIPQGPRSTTIPQPLWRGPGDPRKQATIVVNDAAGGSVFEEVELRLRTSISAYLITGYEINASVNTNPGMFYVTIVRWDGPLGSWTQIGGATYHVQNGDLFKATVVGNVITAYVNGVPLCQATDSTYTNGSPGIGFYLASQTGLNANYGLSNFTATDGQGSPSPNPEPTPQATPTPSPTAAPSATPGPTRTPHHHRRG